MKAIFPSTGCRDLNDREIVLGDKVKSPDGLIGKVRFAHCAWRFDVGGEMFLENNSSLLCCDRWQPKDFEVIK